MAKNTVYLGEHSWGLENSVCTAVAGWRGPTRQWPMVFGSSLSLLIFYRLFLLMTKGEEC